MNNKEFTSEYGAFFIITNETGTRIVPNDDYANEDNDSFDFSKDEEEKIYQLVSEEVGYDLWEKDGVYYVMDYDTKLPEEVIYNLHLVLIQNYAKSINAWVKNNFEFAKSEDSWEDNYGN